MPTDCACCGGTLRHRCQRRRIRDTHHEYECRECGRCGYLLTTPEKGVVKRWGAVFHGIGRSARAPVAAGALAVADGGTP